MSSQLLGKQIRAWGTNGITYDVITHSLGGAVATYWLATETDAPTRRAVRSIMTLDNLVNGVKNVLGDAAKWLELSGQAGRDLQHDSSVTRIRGKHQVRHRMTGRYDRWPPDFSMLAQKFVHGGMYARTVVSFELRELIAIACLTARNALPQLEAHLVVGFRLGIPRAEMQEIMLQMTAYVGSPYVMQAMALFERVAATAEQSAPS